MEINQSKAVQLVAYSGDTLSTLGTTNFDCHLRCTKRNLEFHVVHRPVTPLLDLADSLRTFARKFSNIDFFSANFIFESE